MARPTIDELRDRRSNTMSTDERVAFSETLAAARLALEFRARDSSRGTDRVKRRRSCFAKRR